MRLTSCEVSGSSLFGGMIGFFCRLQYRNRWLSADFPGTTTFDPAASRLPPFITPAYVLISNFDSMMLPEWQTKHLFSKIGSMSFEYSTGSFRLRSTVGIGGKSLGSFFSWVGAMDDAA